jgi:hypothetical protein
MTPQVITAEPKGDGTMTNQKRRQLVNLWNGCFDSDTAAGMVGVCPDDAAKLFAQLDHGFEVESADDIGSDDEYEHYEYPADYV